MTRADKHEAADTATAEAATCAHAAFPPAPPMPELLAAGDPGGNLVDEVALAGQRRVPTHVRAARILLALCVGIILGMASILVWAVWF